MSIGTAIRQLRREHDMTQEQLAGFLGLTSAAVSGWECDRNAPDISQIPQLCAIFGVSSDVLLGIDMTNREKKIDEIVTRAMMNGNPREEVGIYRQGLAEFPSSFELMLGLAHALDYGGEPETYEKRWKERVALLEAVREGTRDASLKNRAEGSLCMAYKEKGMRDEALRIAENMPEPGWTRGRLMRLLAQGMEKVYEIRMGIEEHFFSLCDDLLDFASFSSDGRPLLGPEEAILVLKKIPELHRVFFEDGDYLETSQTVSLAYTRMAERYAELGDGENALSSLISATEYAKAFNAYTDGMIGGHGVTDRGECPVMPKEKQHTSLLMRPEYYHPTATVWYSADGDPDGEIDRVRRAAGNPCFDFIRPRVEELFRES